ncbi:hypothetical protein KQX54_007781 [Cotesia glomerata]|uniref:Uncharacterized protein n=1 Tax=Cotesia glomerata TaxID=32391 RepID=A0AAV7J663_COTGL|nr:hypothetical protein KQX54_007781 [Cotesia glomerata]
MRESLVIHPSTSMEFPRKSIVRFDIDSRCGNPGPTDRLDFTDAATALYCLSFTLTTTDNVKFDVFLHLRFTELNSQECVPTAPQPPPINYTQCRLILSCTAVSACFCLGGALSSDRNSRKIIKRKHRPSTGR